MALLGFGLWTVPAARAGIFTAATCSQSDVNAVVNGPTHTAVDGDTINIPAGSCTWTAGVTVPGGIGISIIGAGASGTTITDNMTSGGSLFYFQPTFGNSLSRLSSMTLTLDSALITNPPNESVPYPIEFEGSCAGGGCPNIRVDHLTVPSSWSGMIHGTSLIVTDDVFGVIDHNTVNAATTSGIELVNVNFSAWLGGSGQYGDASMAAPDTLGSAQAIYIEDNSLSGNVDGVETENAVSYGQEGGARAVGRFNTFTNSWGYCAFSNHGTETDGRPRSSRQFEIYGNNVQAANTSNGSGGVGCFRGGVDIQFGNTLTEEPGAWVNQYFSLQTQRTMRPTVWGLCDGAGAYDVNDGAVTAWTGTIATEGGGTISVPGAPWTAGVYNFSSSSPGSLYYVVFDQTNGELGGIASNTASTLTLSWTGGGFTGQSFSSGDAIEILGSTLYAAGTMTGASGSDTLTDSAKHWAANQWYVPGNNYSVLDVTQGTATQVYGSTSNTITLDSNRYPGWTWNSGDSYVVLRAAKCFDSVSYSGGSLMSGGVPSPLSTFESSDPSYEFADTGSAPGYGYVSVQNDLNIMANRDYYGEASPSPQSSPMSPFNGASGTGYGTLANRPTTCTPRVGYWATDQGSWNQSGNGFGQGELFVCTAPNTWTLYYTPYVYPHPLVSGATPPPLITAFNASPSSISSGQSSTLSWTVSGATSLSISPGIGDVTGQSSVTVSPSTTTVYTLTASNSGGSTPQNVTVTVTNGSTGGGGGGGGDGGTTPTTPTDLSNVRVYPNPWRSDKHSGLPITFANLPASATVKIFTVSGHRVRTLDTRNSQLEAISWDLTNDSGDKVASGVYVYLITDGQGNKIRGKTALIR